MYVNESQLKKLSPDDLQLVRFGLTLGAALFLFICISQLWRGSWLLITTYSIPFAVYVLIIAWLFRKPFLPPSMATRIILIGMSLIYHIMMLFTSQPLSNDVYRYYWDGKILSAGINPYSYPPAAKELAEYRDEYWLRIYNRDIPTGYPILSEALFAFAYRLHPEPWTNRLFSVLGSLGASIMLMSALRISGKNERMALIYAWSPLVAIEFGNSGHLDAFGIFFLCAALAMNLRKKPIISAICLALGGLAKFFPVVLLPLWGRRWPRSAWLAFFFSFTIPWLILSPGGTPVKGLSIFAIRGDFNSSLYRLLVAGWECLVNSSSAELAARITSTAILSIGYLVLLKRRDRETVLSGWRSARQWLGLVIILSPVVHPWYICWLLAFISLDFSISWLVLSGTIIFARYIYIPFERTGVWREAGWTALAVYLPFYTSLMTILVRRYWDKFGSSFRGSDVLDRSGR